MSSEWRKVSNKLEGEPEFDALEKMERLETFQVCRVGVLHAAAAAAASRCCCSDSTSGVLLSRYK